MNSNLCAAYLNVHKYSILREVMSVVKQDAAFNNEQK